MSWMVKAGFEMGYGWEVRTQEELGTVRTISMFTYNLEGKHGLLCLLLLVTDMSLSSGLRGMD